VKVALDTMVWVSYCTLKGGFRHRLIERARRQRVRFFVSEYILDELVDVVVEDLGRSRRYALLARRAVLRIAKLVLLPPTPRRFVPGDPDDDPVVSDGAYREGRLSCDYGPSGPKSHQSAECGDIDSDSVR
jgi:predicted nucleic acid-binding protein